MSGVVGGPLCPCGEEDARWSERFGQYLCRECLDLVVDNWDRPEEFVLRAQELESLNDLWEQDMRTGRLLEAHRNGTPVVDGAKWPTFHPGGIVLDAPERIPAIWGRDHGVLWSEGEELVIAGPVGVGKTTLAQQLTLARCGIGDGIVLGFPVAASDQRTLYIAADRPKQALRSMRRMVELEDRRKLVEKLVVWKEPVNLLSDPEALLAILADERVGTVVIDSIKDVAGDVADTRVGTEFNKTIQALVAAEIEVVSLHHTRKAQPGNKKPKRLDDLYGAVWIGAGAGSVVCLWGQPGDDEVELLHLKQPDNVVGPLTVIHDHTTGTSTLRRTQVTEGERERMRKACVAVLTEKSPLGKGKLVAAVREKGVEGGTEKLGEWANSLALDPESGFDRSDKGFVLTPNQNDAGQGLVRGHSPHLPTTPISRRDGVRGGGPTQNGSGQGVSMADQQVLGEDYEGGVDR